MNLMRWRPSFSLGVPSVDQEHREMIELINGVYRAFSGQTDADGIEAMLGEIHAAIGAHFALEERLMRAASYPEYAVHKQDHESLLEQIRDLMDDYVADPGRGRLLLQARLSEWFERHFASFDARLHGELIRPPLPAND